MIIVLSEMAYPSGSGDRMQRTNASMRPVCAIYDGGHAF
jgi:hypothetical protein